jgi:hypothetical protein
MDPAVPKRSVRDDPAQGHHTVPVVEIAPQDVSVDDYTSSRFSAVPYVPEWNATETFVDGAGI